MAPFDWLGFIAGPGFAIAVAVYLLTQTVPTVQKLVETIADLKTSVDTTTASMQKSVDRLNDSVNYLASRSGTPSNRLGDMPVRDPS